MNFDEYMGFIKKIAMPTLPAPICAHVKIGNTKYHIAMVRGEKSRIWPTIDGIVFGHEEFSGENEETLLIYLNSFLSANELVEVAGYFYEQHDLELSGIQKLEFPMSLPFALTYFNVEEIKGTEVVTIGNRSVAPPLILRALYFDVYGDSGEWADNIFRDDFGWRERHGSGIHSFVIPEGEILPDVEIRGYSETSGKCFLDEIKGVHEGVLREKI